MSRITIARIYRITDGSPLLEDITDSVPATGGRLKVEAVTDFDPADDGEVRYAVVDSEHISYTDIDETTDELVNITRGANSTVAAAHTAGTFVQAGLVAKSEKFADGFIDDDDTLAEGVEIMRHLWRMYPVGDRDNDEMELATVRFQDDGHPIIIDAPEDDRAGSPTFFTWSKTGVIATGTRPHRFPVPYGGSLEEFRMTLGEGGEADDDVIADILKDGVSILTEKLTVPAGLLISNRVTPTTKEVRKGDILQVQFEQVGTTDKGSNPTLYGSLYPSEAVVSGRIEVEGPDGAAGADGADGADGSDGLISEVQNEGSPVTDAGVMDFTGAGVDVTSDGSVITVTVPGGSASSPDYIKKPGNEQVTNSTVLQDDDAFVWSLAANKKYLIFGPLGVYGGSTPDIDITFDGPADSTINWHAIGPAVGFGGATNEGTAKFVQAGKGAEVNFGMSQVGPPLNPTIFVYVLVEMVTAGDVKLRWAQNVASGAASTFIINGSFLTVMEVV